MIGTCEFVTYVSGVPATGANCGGPSNCGVNFGPFLSGTVAVCGIEFSMTASCACGVPATVGQHGAGERLRRDAREVRRQLVARDERPGPVEARRHEPAAGEQRVIVVVGGVDQHIARRVRRPQELRADDGHEIGLALEDDQFRRHLARVDRRHAVGERRLGIGLGTAVEEVDGAGLGEALRDAVDAGAAARNGCLPRARRATTT